MHDFVRLGARLRLYVADPMMTSEAAAPQENLVELEIAAFMGPHIKRARYVLVAVGLLYAITGYLAYGDIAKLRDAVHNWRASGATGIDTFERGVTLAYASVVIVIIAGVANIVLAGVAGRKTMLAFYAAMGIFVAHSAFQFYISEGALITSLVWWLTAICLGMGFQAALKAERLRKGGQPSL